MPDDNLRIYKKKRHIMLDNFLGGIAWGLGTVVGISIIAVFVGFLISKIDLIPIIGDWLANVLRYTQASLSRSQIQ